MSEVSEQPRQSNVNAEVLWAYAPGSKSGIVRRIVEFGSPDDVEGMAWGVEINFDVTNSLAKNAFNLIKIPEHIKKIVYLDLCPQEELPPKMRTIRSKISPNSSYLKTIGAAPILNRPRLVEKFRNFMNLMSPQDNKRFALLADMIYQVANKGEALKKFNQTLIEAKGDSIVIIHGHSSDLNNSSALGEQYPDKLVDSKGRLVQRPHNAVLIDDLLERYDDPNKFAVIVLNGCNPKGVGPQMKKVPVFYPRDYAGNGRGGWAWSKAGGFSVKPDQPSN